MYIKVGNEYADSEFQYLSELLNMLDQKIIHIRQQISNSSDPESDGLTDRGEYFIGIGFTAIQQYITDSLTLTKTNKKEALNLGPKYSETLTCVSIINAAANWWKHSAEWFPSGTDRKDAINTQQIILSVTESSNYELSNVLAKLLATSKISLCALLPILSAWRELLDQHKNA